MRRHEHLRVRRHLPTFFREPIKQPRVQVVLWLLNTQQREWVWVVQEYQIRQHFECSVRRKPREEWFGERSVLDSEQESPVRHRFRRDLLESRNTTTKGRENLAQSRWVALAQILND